MASVRHALVNAYVVATRRKTRSTAQLDRRIARRRPWPADPPRSTPGSPVSVRSDGDWPLVALGGAGRGTLVALHGGGYVFGPESQHWTTWRRISRASGWTVVAPLYRLAPEGTADDTVPHVVRIVERLAEEGPVALMGDSAGGGIALAVAQLLRERGLRPPLLLSAPWLDATVADPWRPGTDPWLTPEGLRDSADRYRGDLSAEHPFLSPLQHDVGRLGPIVVACGTRDVLYTDSLRLTRQVEGAGGRVRLLVGEGLIHNYPVLPIPEARPVLRAFVDVLRAGEG